MKNRANVNNVMLVIQFQTVTFICSLVSVCNHLFMTFCHLLSNDIVLLQLTLLIVDCNNLMSMFDDSIYKKLSNSYILLGRNIQI